MTFRQKIIALLVVAATFPVLFAGLLAVRSYQREMVERIDDYNLRVATMAAAQIEDFLQNAERALALSVGLVPFAEFERASLGHALNIPYRQFDFINIAALLDERNVPVVRPAYESYPEELSGLEAHEAIFDTDVRSFLARTGTLPASIDGTVWGDAYTGGRLQTPRVWAALPIPYSEEGGARWRFVAEISLESVQQRVVAVKPSRRGVAFVVDGEGRTVCHSDPGKAGVRDSLRDLGVVSQGIRAGAPLTARYQDAQGGEMAGAYAPISSGGWGLVVAQPVEEAFASVTKMRSRTVYWGVIALAAAILGGLVLSLGLSAPVKALAEGAEQIAKGRYGETISVRSKGDLAMLADAFNKMSGALASSFDTITRQKEEISAWNEELQARVRARTRELREAEEQIIRSEKMAAVAELSAGMAHEINNPLTSILGFSQLMLRQTESTHPFNRYLNAVSEGAARIRDITDDMLRFSKQSSKANFADTDVNYLLDSTIKLAARQLSERSIRVETRLDPNIPRVHGDATELQQVFIHLVNNAKNAMPDGGTLRVDSVVVDRGAVKVTVHDSGVGIPEENLTNIFTPFFTTGKERGRTGVGLSVSERIVKEHGGKISVDSTPGEGTAFAVYLPGVPRGTHLG